MGLGGNSRAMLFLAFAAFSFVAALSISYYSFKLVADTNEKTNMMIVQSDRNMTTTLKTPTTYYVTGAEVRQSIYKIRDIGVDIMVDNVLYSKTLEPTTVNVEGINLTKKYSPTYLRDSNGILTLLQFD